MKKNEETMTMDDIVERARISYLFWKYTQLIPGSLQSIREACSRNLNASSHVKCLRRTK